MGTLVLLRHGQSQWNRENRFTGWVDVPLTDDGRKEASRAAEQLRAIPCRLAFCSRLKRTEETLAIILDHGRGQVPVIADSALNERRYGDLQGRNKDETAQIYGEDQVRLWRRSFFTRPPHGESMEDCERRTLPFFRQYILPTVQAGQNVFVVAHGNSIRPILKYLEHLEPDAVARQEIPCCEPFIYVFQGKGYHRHLLN